MSTHIDNGYRLPQGMDFPGLLAWVQGIRPSLREVATTSLQQVVLAQAVELFDADLARARGLVVDGASQPQGCCLRRAKRAVHDEIRRCRQENRRCSWDPHATLAVLADGAELFGLLYAEQPELPALFARLPGVAPYPYSNGTDAPSGFTQAQWDARGAHWDKLLGPAGRPSDVCATFELVPPDILDLLPWPDSLASVVAVHATADRLRARAHQLALSTPAARLCPADQAEFDATLRLSIWVRHDERLRTDQVPAFSAQRDAIGHWLVPCPTLEQLRAAAPSTPSPSPRP